MKSVLLLNDVSSVGGCSTAVQVPILSTMCCNALPVATALYSRQTGFGSYHVLSNNQLTDFCKDVFDAQSVNAILTGFCPNIITLKAVKQVVTENKTNASLVVVDPAMGDNGKLYALYDNSYVETMKEIVAVADVITPNLTEACLLTNTDYNELISHSNENDYLLRCGKLFEKSILSLGTKSAVITGVLFKNYICNIVIESDGVHYITNDYIGGVFNGTGDMFASALLGYLLCGKSLCQSATDSARFVASACSNTTNNDGKHGTEFQKVLRLLLRDF